MRWEQVWRAREGTGGHTGTQHTTTEGHPSPIGEDSWLPLLCVYCCCACSAAVILAIAAMICACSAGVAATMPPFRNGKKRP